MAKEITSDFEEKKGLIKFFSNLKKYLFGVLAGVAVLLIALCLCALVLTISGIPDGAVPVLAYLCAALAAFAAGFAAVRLLRSSGLVNGLITGAIMFVVQFFFSLAFSDGTVFSLQTLIYLLINLLLASLGGIAGVNIRKRRF